MWDSDGNYNSLDLDHKKEFLLNQLALFLAVENLAIALKCDRHDLMQELWESAYEKVKNLPVAEIYQQVAKLEAKHRPFDSPGAIILDELN